MSRVHALDHRHGLPQAELTALVGGKAAGLNVMATELGLPVPPGFVITTPACLAYLDGGWPPGLDEEILSQLSRLEASAGRRLGDPSDPLLLSVRSGAPVSMPGMLDTILDLGLNDATTGGLAATTGDPGFAADCRQRFSGMYREIVGGEPPDDPRLQLRGAIEAVFRSWNGERARAYREREGIGERLGTAVTVQAMVFGNRGPDSATGVMFTRNPATGENAPYGDLLFGAQGEDVVAGTHPTQPLSALESRLPAVAGELRRHATSLERYFRDLCDIEFTVEGGRLWLLQVRVGKRSPQAALRIAVEMADDPRFPLTREEAVRRVAPLLDRPPTVSLRSAGAVPPLTTGLPASPGVATGEIATSPDLAEAVAREGRPVILVRSETSPDDVRGMARAAGVLTALGGLGSHAAVVARGWGIPAVVGAGDVEVEENGIVIRGKRLSSGRLITIDGSTGEVFDGPIVGSSSLVPEAATLLGWAAQLGIRVGADAEWAPAREVGGGAVREGVLPAGALRDGVRAGGADRQSEHAPGAAASQASGPGELTVPGPAGAGGGEPTTDDLARLLGIKGTASREDLAVTALAPLDRIGAVLDDLVERGLVEASGDGFRLTGGGRLLAARLFAGDRQRLGGGEACVAALEGFAVLDRRMKETVTAWQLRDRDGEQVLNDHLDNAYDGRVIERLAALHADAEAWLRPLTERAVRLDRYRVRLGRALELAGGGDGRYVASPRVDSYHGIWFELHEDLLRLADRQRSEEAARGSA